MNDFDELLTQIPVADIARRIGVDQDVAADAIRQVVPGLVGGMQANATGGGAASLERALQQHSGTPRLRSADEIDTADGTKIVRHVFGENTDRVAAKLADASPQADVTQTIIQQILPIVAPIVLAWLANRFLGGGQQQSPSADGGLGDLLGGLLGGGSAGSSSSGGVDLGGLLGGLGGLLGGGTR